MVQRNGAGGLIAIILFIVLYKFGDALAGSMSNPLYVHLGFTKVEVATIAKVYGVIATLAGVALGGVLVMRWGVFTALLVCGGMQALSNLMYVLQLWAGHDLLMLSFTIGGENLTGGMASAAFVAYLSGLCSRDFTATQYALLSSLATVGLNVLAASGGWLAEELGWTPFFILSTLFCVPSLLLLLWIMRRQTGRRAGSAVGKQPAAVALQPGARLGVVRVEALDDAPEARPVVHLGEVRHLVRDDVVDHRFRREDQPPAERQIALARTAAPAALGIAHRDPVHRLADPGGMVAGAVRQFAAGEMSEMVAHPPRQVRRVAAHPDLAVADFDRRRRRVRLTANAVRHAHHRHDCALAERYRLRQGREPCGDPAAMRIEKAQPLLGRDALRDHQFDGAVGGVDPQQEAAGARADANRHRRADIERLRAALHLLKCGGFASQPEHGSPWLGEL